MKYSFLSIKKWVKMLEIRMKYHELRIEFSVPQNYDDVEISRKTTIKVLGVKIMFPFYTKF